jgi:hypothetical protein
MCSSSGGSLLKQTYNQKNGENGLKRNLYVVNLLEYTITWSVHKEQLPNAEETENARFCKWKVSFLNYLFLVMMYFGNDWLELVQGI